jgi:hypothetical protein
MWRWEQGRIFVLRTTDHQRHITREATEELKSNGFESLAYVDDGECPFIPRRNNVYKSFPDPCSKIATALDQLRGQIRRNAVGDPFSSPNKRVHPIYALLPELQRRLHLSLHNGSYAGIVCRYSQGSNPMNGLQLLTKSWHADKGANQCEPRLKSARAKRAIQRHRSRSIGY